MDATSDEVMEILKSGDKHIKESVNNAASIDEHGFMRMKEELESMGLSIPEPMKIARELVKRGFYVDPGVLTSSEAADAIFNALRRRY